MMRVACCYCGHEQAVADPPALVDCVWCRRSFRVFRRESGQFTFELGEQAKRFYAARRGSAA